MTLAHTHAWRPSPPSARGHLLPCLLRSPPCLSLSVVPGICSSDRAPLVTMHALLPAAGQVCQGDSREERIAAVHEFLRGIPRSNWSSGNTRAVDESSSPVHSAVNLVASLLAACEQPGAPHHPLLPVDILTMALFYQAMQQARLRAPPSSPAPLLL